MKNLYDSIDFDCFCVFYLFEFMFSVLPHDLFEFLQSSGTWQESETGAVDLQKG